MYIKCTPVDRKIHRSVLLCIRVLEKEKQEIIARQLNPIYQKGLKSLMGIGVEQGDR